MFYIYLFKRVKLLTESEMGTVTTYIYFLIVMIIVIMIIILMTTSGGRSVKFIPSINN